jgi:hypothetical protein
MIIARTAVRISLFGGGTEYPNWVEHGNKGLVIGGTINKYSYIMLRSLPGFFDYKSKIAYSEIEHVKNNQEIQHKVINALVNYYAPNDGLEITHLADLPSKSGIGSSSTFLVCLLHALITYKNLSLNKTELLNKAIEFEQDILKEDVGYQDSAWAVHGGFNTIQFEQNRKITVVGAASETFINDLSGGLHTLQENQIILESHLKNLRNDFGLSVQKLGIVKFNPFEGGSGNLSFSLALLDGHNTGILLTSMHGREQNRVYTKQVINGKCEIQLTEEELKAIEQAENYYKKLIS